MDEMGEDMRLPRNSSQDGIRGNPETLSSSFPLNGCAAA